MELVKTRIWSIPETAAFGGTVNYRNQNKVMNMNDAIALRMIDVITGEILNNAEYSTLL